MPPKNAKKNAVPPSAPAMFPQPFQPRAKPRHIINPLTDISVSAIGGIDDNDVEVPMLEEKRMYELKNSAERYVTRKDGANRLHRFSLIYRPPRVEVGRRAARQRGGGGADNSSFSGQSPNNRAVSPPSSSNLFGGGLGSRPITLATSTLGSPSLPESRSATPTAKVRVSKSTDNYPPSELNLIKLFAFYKHIHGVTLRVHEEISRNTGINPAELAYVESRLSSAFTAMHLERQREDALLEAEREERERQEREREAEAHRQHQQLLAQQQDGTASVASTAARTVGGISNRSAISNNNNGQSSRSGGITQANLRALGAHPALAGSAAASQTPTQQPLPLVDAAAKECAKDKSILKQLVSRIPMDVPAVVLLVFALYCGSSEDFEALFPRDDEDKDALDGMEGSGTGSVLSGHTGHSSGQQANKDTHHVPTEADRQRSKMRQWLMQAVRTAEKAKAKRAEELMQQQGKIEQNNVPPQQSQQQQPSPINPATVLLPPIITIGASTPTKGGNGNHHTEAFSAAVTSHHQAPQQAGTVSLSASALLNVSGSTSSAHQLTTTTTASQANSAVAVPNNNSPQSFQLARSLDELRIALQNASSSFAANAAAVADEAISRWCGTLAVLVAAVTFYTIPPAPPVITILPTNSPSNSRPSSANASSSRIGGSAAAGASTSSAFGFGGGKKEKGKSPPTKNNGGGGALGTAKTIKRLSNAAKANNSPQLTAANHSGLLASPANAPLNLMGAPEVDPVLPTLGGGGDDPFPGADASLGGNNPLSSSDPKNSSNSGLLKSPTSNTNINTSILQPQSRKNAAGNSTLRAPASGGGVSPRANSLSANGSNGGAADSLATSVNAGRAPTPIKQQGRQQQTSPSQARAGTPTGGNGHHGKLSKRKEEEDGASSASSPSSPSPLVTVKHRVQCPTTIIAVDQMRLLALNVWQGSYQPPLLCPMTAATASSNGATTIISSGVGTNIMLSNNGFASGSPLAAAASSSYRQQESAAPMGLTTPLLLGSSLNGANPLQQQQGALSPFSASSLANNATTTGPAGVMDTDVLGLAAAGAAALIPSELPVPLKRKFGTEPSPLITSAEASAAEKITAMFDGWHLQLTATELATPSGGGGSRDGKRSGSVASASAAQDADKKKKAAAAAAAATAGGGKQKGKGKRMSLAVPMTPEEEAVYLASLPNAFSVEITVRITNTIPMSWFSTHGRENEYLLSPLLRYRIKDIDVANMRLCLYADHEKDLEPICEEQYTSAVFGNVTPAANAAAAAAAAALLAAENETLTSSGKNSLQPKQQRKSTTSTASATQQQKGRAAAAGAAGRKLSAVGSPTLRPASKGINANHNPKLSGAGGGVSEIETFEVIPSLFYPSVLDDARKASHVANRMVHRLMEEFIQPHHCHKHASQKFNFFCIVCREFICNSCAREAHANHARRPLKEFAQAEILRMDPKVEALKRRIGRLKEIIGALEPKATSLHALIDSGIDGVSTTLERHRATLHADAEARANRQLSQILHERARCVEEQSRIREAVEVVKSGVLRGAIPKPLVAAEYFQITNQLALQLPAHDIRKLISVLTWSNPSKYLTSTIYPPPPPVVDGPIVVDDNGIALSSNIHERNVLM